MESVWLGRWWNEHKSDVLMLLDKGNLNLRSWFSEKAEDVSSFIVFPFCATDHETRKFSWKTLLILRVMSLHIRTRHLPYTFPLFRKLTLNCPHDQPEHKWRKQGFHEQLAVFCKEGQWWAGDDEENCHILLYVLFEAPPESWRILGVMDLSRFCEAADGLKRWRRRCKGLGIIFARTAALSFVCMFARRGVNWLIDFGKIDRFAFLPDCLICIACTCGTDWLTGGSDWSTGLVAKNQIWVTLDPPHSHKDYQLALPLIWINVKIIVINLDKWRR